jgi:pyruvate ferredoxin oxidoreductase beta subunit
MYSNTGIQRSGATPKYAWTTTTWSGKGEQKKDLVEIIIAHNPAYLATASVGYPEDIYEKALKAKGIKGPKYMEIIAPCPPGWKFPMNKTLELGRMAVETGLWPLFEYENGRHSFTGVSKQLLSGAREFKPIEDYLKIQGRFGQLFSPAPNAGALAEIAKNRDDYWKRMRARVKMEEELAKQ